MNKNEKYIDSIISDVLKEDINFNLSDNFAELVSNKAKSIIEFKEKRNRFVILFGSLIAIIAVTIGVFIFNDAEKASELYAIIAPYKWYILIFAIFLSFFQFVDNVLIKKRL